LLGSITQPFGHGAAQEEAKMYCNTWIPKHEYSKPILMVDKYDNHNVTLKHLQIKCIIVKKENIKNYEALCIMKFLDNLFRCEYEHTSGLDTNSSEKRAWQL
jgi:hypothetical protein